MCAAGWPLAAYVLIGRDDITATAEASAAIPADNSQSSVPLASPVSSLALATPLHHGAGGGSSPKRPSLGRTPIRQPHLGTLPGTALKYLCPSRVDKGHCRCRRASLTSYPPPNPRLIPPFPPHPAFVPPSSYIAVNHKAWVVHELPELDKPTAVRAKQCSHLQGPANYILIYVVTTIFYVGCDRKSTSMQKQCSPGRLLQSHMTISGATLGGRQRSRLSIGARALGTPPDPTQMPRPLHAAPPTPPLLAPHPSSARAGPQPAALPQGSPEALEVPLRGLSVPYTQRLQTAGVQPPAF